MYLQQRDFDKIRKIAKDFKNAHMSIETIFYHIFTDKNQVKYLKSIMPELDTKSISEEIEMLLKSLPTTEQNPIPAFDFELFVKECLTMSILRGEKDITISEAFNALVDPENDMELVEIFEQNGLPLSLNIFDKTNEGQSQMERKPTSAMDEIEFKKFTIPLHKKLPENFTPSIGCEEYINEMQRILLRKEKNSVIVMGEPGVGKTNVVYTLVEQLSKGNTHSNLKNVKIHSLNINALLSDVKFNGVLEARINSIINYVSANPEIILFVDEIHTLAGNNAGGGEMLNFLKTPMTNGQLKIIGTTTPAEYNKYFSKNPAFARRMSTITIEEPSTELTAEILKARIPEYTKFYKVNIASDVVDTLVKVSEHYGKSRKNPDKSIDILDSMLSRKVLQGGKTLEVTDVYHEISKEYRVPSDEISVSNLEKLTKLKNSLNTNLIGQDNAFEALIDSLTVSMAGLRDKQKTMGNFLFQGMTSTGKTEAAKIISKTLGIPLLRYDMSAYQEKHTISTLIGSPPGYVGYNEGAGAGKLITDIEKNPHCVLLLDEVEKAHPDVLTVLLQIMDYGTLSSASGKEVYFNKVILIMTSNVGSAASVKNPIGFGNKDQSNEIIDEHVSSMFLPEIRARIDNIIKFKRLTIDDFKKIVGNQITQFTSEIVQYNIKLSVEDSVIDKIASESLSTNLGARNVQHIISKTIKPKIAKIILENPARTIEITKSISIKEGAIDII